MAVGGLINFAQTAQGRCLPLAIVNLLGHFQTLFVLRNGAI